MANKYVKTNWLDHVVENPNRFKEIRNQDGTVSLEHAPGEVLQHGTPVNAQKLNKMENGIYNNSLLANENREYITSLLVEVAILKNATLNNLTNNVFIENFDTLDAVKVSNGVYDSVNKRLVI